MSPLLHLHFVFYHSILHPTLHCRPTTLTLAQRSVRLSLYAFTSSVTHSFVTKSFLPQYFLDCLTSNMKAARSFETSVTTLLKTWRHIPENLNFQQYRWENLKRRIYSDSLSCTRTNVQLLNGTFLTGSKFGLKKKLCCCLDQTEHSISRMSL